MTPAQALARAIPDPYGPDLPDDVAGAEDILRRLAQSGWRLVPTADAFAATHQRRRVAAAEAIDIPQGFG